MHSVAPSASGEAVWHVSINDVPVGPITLEELGHKMEANAISEYSAADTALRQVCKEFKALMRRYMEELCVELDAPDPAGLADELALLLEGAIVTAQVSQLKGRAAQVAKTAATALIAQAMTDAGDVTHEA